jgi:glycosyltransferase involved in cell wall biosynthesis
MEILFLGLLFREEDEKIILNNSKVGINNSCNTLQWNLIKGFKENENINIKIINSIPSGNYPILNRKLFFETREWIHGKTSNKEVGFINFYIVKHFMRQIKYYKEIIKWIKDNKEKEKCIVIYDMYLPFLKNIKKLTKAEHNVKKCLIVGDLPNEYGHSYEKIKSSFKYYFLKYRGLKSMELIKYFDSYVLLTEYMKLPLKIKDKPYVVVEGVVDENRKYYPKNSIKEYNNKIIMYTGILNEQYGIRTLLDAFNEVKDQNYELWLCGNGDMNEYIKKKSAEDNRIKYFGYVRKNKLLELEKEITVYINPRTNEGRYTKYSFPSKTMEYMLSGKPILMYKLDGIPDEYDQYLYYIEGNQASDIADKILEICEKPQCELDDFGQKARLFVLENKNSKIQAKKIIDMIK